MSVRVTQNKSCVLLFFLHLPRGEVQGQLHRLDYCDKLPKLNFNQSGQHTQFSTRPIEQNQQQPGTLMHTCTNSFAAGE